jgi:hypothetical protein
VPEGQPFHLALTFLPNPLVMTLSPTADIVCVTPKSETIKIYFINLALMED